MAILLDAILEGIEEAAEQIRSDVMAEVRMELAPIYQRLDRLEAARERRSRRPRSWALRCRAVGIDFDDFDRETRERAAVGPQTYDEVARQVMSERLSKWRF